MREHSVTRLADIFTDTTSRPVTFDPKRVQLAQAVFASQHDQIQESQLHLDQVWEETLEAESPLGAFEVLSVGFSSLLEKLKSTY